MAPTEEAVELYRALAAENPAFLPDLAMALEQPRHPLRRGGAPRRGGGPDRGGGRALSRAGRREPRLPRPTSPVALNNLGACYGEVGAAARRWPRPRRRSSVYRALAAENPAFLPNLAMALNNLGNRYSEVGQPERAELAWQSALDSVSPAGAATLLAARAASAPPGSRSAGHWLATALSLAAGDRSVLAVLHDEVRRHRADDPAASTPRGRATRARNRQRGRLSTSRFWPQPRAWIDDGHVSRGARLHCRAPELLDASADLCVDETLLSLAEDDAERYTSLAREGTDGRACRPPMSRCCSRSSPSSSSTGDVSTQRALLAERRDDLLSDEARAYVASVADEHDEEPSAQHALALLELAALGDEDAAFATLGDPTTVRRVAVDARAASRRERAGACRAAHVLRGGDGRGACRRCSVLSGRRGGDRRGCRRGVATARRSAFTEP